MDGMEEIEWEKKRFNSNAMWNETKQKAFYNIVVADCMTHNLHQPANVMVAENG